MKRLLTALAITLVLMVFIPDADAVMVKETCMNATYLLTTYEYNMTTTGTTTEYNYTQIHNCTAGCNDNRCEATNIEADTSLMWIVYLTGVVLLSIATFLGIPFGKLVGKEDVVEGWDTRLVPRVLFFFIGLYLVYLSLGMSRRIGTMYGAESDVAAAGGVAALVMSTTIILFLFVFVLDFWFGFLKGFIEEVRDKRFELRKI